MARRTNLVASPAPVVRPTSSWNLTLLVPYLGAAIFLFKTMVKNRNTRTALKLFGSKDVSSSNCTADIDLHDDVRPAGAAPRPGAGHGNGHGMRHSGLHRVQACVRCQYRCVPLCQNLKGCLFCLLRVLDVARPTPAYRCLQAYRPLPALLVLSFQCALGWLK